MGIIRWESMRTKQKIVRLRKEVMQTRHFVDPKQLAQVLSQHGIFHVFHANAVETSFSFLREGHLLSREQCANSNIPMAPQMSDDKDKRYGIFDDLFFNYRDLHEQFRRANDYGPILFKVPVAEFLKFLLATGASVSVTTQWIPHKWQDDDTVDDRWVRDVAKIFEPSHPDIVVRFPRMSLEYVDQIVIDNLPDRPLFFDQTESAYQNCANAHGFTVNIQRRQCQISNCRCASGAFKKWPERYRAGQWNGKYGKIDDVA